MLLYFAVQIEAWTKRLQNKSLQILHRANKSVPFVPSLDTYGFPVGDEGEGERRFYKSVRPSANL